MRKALSLAEVLKVSNVDQQKHVQELSRNAVWSCPEVQCQTLQCAVSGATDCIHMHLGL